jgi:hypothetical protein
VAFALPAWQELLDLTEAEVRHRFATAGGEVDPDRRYEGLEHVTQYYNPAVLPVRLYVRDGRVQMVYVPSGPALAGTTPSEIDAQVGGRGQRLRSRTGKTANQYVQAERGVAYAEDGGTVQFVEIFPPRSHAAYLQDIYQDPGPFTR